MEHPFLQRWGGVMDNANATIQLLRTIRAIRLGIFCWLHAPVKFHLRGEHINLTKSWQIQIARHFSGGTGPAHLCDNRFYCKSLLVTDSQSLNDATYDSAGNMGKVCCVCYMTQGSKF